MFSEIVTYHVKRAPLNTTFDIRFLHVSGGVRSQEQYGQTF